MNERSVKKWIVETVLSNLHESKREKDGIMICEKCNSVYLSSTLRCPVCGKPAPICMRIEAAKLVVEKIILDYGNVEIRLPSEKAD